MCDAGRWAAETRLRQSLRRAPGGTPAGDRPRRSLDHLCLRPCQLRRQLPSMKCALRRVFAEFPRQYERLPTVPTADCRYFDVLMPESVTRLSWRIPQRLQAVQKYAYGYLQSACE